MAKFKWKYGLILVAVVVTLIFAVRSGVYAGDKGGTGAAVPVISVKVTPAQYSETTPTLRLSGSIESQTTAAVSAKIAGRIAEVLVQDGQTVKAGDPLVTLEAVELANGARQAGDALRKAQISYDLANSDYNRYDTLYTKGAISAQQLENAAAKLKMAEADLSSAAANHSSANQQLGYSVITAPVDGMIANRSATIGQVVSPGAPLVTVQDIRSVYAVINVEQKSLAALKEGQTASVVVDAYPGKSFTGTVETINPEASSASRMFRTKIKIANSDSQLRPGMFAAVELQTGEKQAVLTVPQAAVVQKQGQYYVFVIQNNKAVRKQIEVGALTGSQIEVKSGLADGELIIATSANRLKDGDAVRAAE